MADHSPGRVTEHVVTESIQVTENKLFEERLRTLEERVSDLERKVINLRTEVHHHHPNVPVVANAQIATMKISQR